MKPLSRAEKRAGAGLLLLCLLPVGVAWFVERQKAAHPKPAPIKVSQKTLAKYTGIVPLGGTGYVRLGDQGFGGGEEGEWDIYVSGPPRPLEIHPNTAPGWKVEFVEELPDWNGSKSVGVKVSVPPRAHQAVEMGANVGMFHSRKGRQLYYSQPFGVKRPAPSQARRTSRLNDQRF